MAYIFYLSFLVAAELAYFKIADHFNIIDKPNHRSSHSQITIRGGGIIFPLAVLIWFFFSGLQYPLFVCGTLLISAVSFVDDLKDFSKRIRLVIHFIAVLLAFSSLGAFSNHWGLAIVVFVFFIGVINAYNFMDGINGITGTYSLVTLVALLWINNYQVRFVDTSLLIVVTIAVAVFNFFNFRDRARCFAGDVGSISIAFIICFFLIKLMLGTADIRYILLLCVYGIDAVITITLRLIKGENIFLAHRTHLYQLLVNEYKLKHLTVSVIYGAIQLAINTIVIFTITINPYQIIACILAPLIMIYILIRKIITQQLSKTSAS